MDLFAKTFEVEEINTQILVYMWVDEEEEEKPYVVIFAFYIEGMCIKQSITFKTEEKAKDIFAKTDVKVVTSMYYNIKDMSG
jgi:hypothetical protein